MSVHGPLGATQGGAVELRAGALASRVRSSRTGLLALSGLLVGGLVISVSAAGTDLLLPESTRPVPAWLAGPFGSTGIELGSAGLIAVLAMMLACYVIAVGSADRLSGRIVLMSIAGLHALILLAPPLLSTDIFSYQFYGRMGALYGANPYLAGPHALALDPLFPYIGAKWAYTPTVYGPGFTALSYLLAPLSIAASALVYKAIAAVASLGTVVLVWNAARLRGINPVKAAALVGLNPLIVVYGVGGGHNDLLVTLALATAIYLLLRHKERAGGGVIVIGSMVKLTAGLLLPFALADGRRRPARDGRRDVLIGAGAVAALAALTTLAWLGTGTFHLLATIQQVQSEGDWRSIPGFIGTRFGLGPVSHTVGLILAVGFSVTSCWLLREVWRGELDWIDGAAWATAALLCSASSLLPWYVAWLMPLAALAADRRLWRAAIWMTVVVQAIQLLGYIPHGSTLLGL